VSSPIHRRVAVAAAGTALALIAGGCREPFPATTPEGWTPSIQWVDSPGAAVTYVDDVAPGATATVLLRSRTFPSATMCTGMNPAILAHFCDTWYQGTGIVVRVPERCQAAARSAPVRSAVPPVTVTVAGVATSAPAIADVDPQYGAQTANAFFLTVSGVGELTTGMTLHAEGGVLFQIQSRATPRLPDQASYEVALSCAVGPDPADAARWLQITYQGTIPRGGLPSPLAPRP
jgi:hypothetical protein